jgi:uncharacterized protein YaaW (UPF0174 family)
MEISTLEWAKQHSKTDASVQTFWKELGEAMGEPETSSAQTILTELQKNGGSTFLNQFRTSFVPYSTIVREVAEALRPNMVSRIITSESTPFPSKNATTTEYEEYILTRMNISNDIAKLCSDIAAESYIAAGKKITQNNAPIFAEALLKALGMSITSQVGVTIGKKVGQVVAKRVFEQASQKIAQETGKKVASKTVQKAAEKVAAETSKRVAQQTALIVAEALKWIFLAFTVIQLDGAALRKTIPGVVYLSILKRIKTAHEFGQHFQ